MIIFIIFILDVIMFTSIYTYNLCIPIPILYLWYIIFKIFKECRFTNVHTRAYADTVLVVEIVHKMLINGHVCGHQALRRGLEWRRVLMT